MKLVVRTKNGPLFSQGCPLAGPWMLLKETGPAGLVPTQKDYINNHSSKWKFLFSSMFHTHLEMLEIIVHLF